MGSRETLVQFLSGKQLTNRVSLSEFQEIVEKSAGSSRDGVIPREKVLEWYAAYRARDEEETNATRSRVDEFLTRIEQAEIRKLENSQLQESLTLEEVVNSMYNVDQILDARLKTLNVAIRSNAEVLAHMNDILTRANESKTNEDYGDLLSVLDDYRTMIERD